MTSTDPPHPNPAAGCLLCGGAALRPLVRGYDRMQAREEDYQYCRCSSCGLVAQSPLPAPEALAGFYPERYSPHVAVPSRRQARRINRLAIKYFYHVDSVSRSPLLRRVFRLVSGRIMKGIREPHGSNRLLDVGCGSGGLLEQYQALGWRVHGIEINPKACAACRERGLEVHQGTVFDAPFDRGQFDMILLNHVLEHVLDPVAVLQRVAELLAPQGVLIVTTPNIHGIGFTLYGSCWYLLDAPRHIALFEPGTIRRLGAKAGVVTHRVVTHSVPRILCDSRHYLETQGQDLPEGLARRAELLAASARAKRRYRAYRKLVAPLTLLSSMVGRGDILEAEYRLRKNT